MRSLRFLLYKEVLQIFRDRVTLVMLFVMPIGQLLLLANAATFEVRRSRLFVVDMDHSGMTSELIGRLTSSGRFVAAGSSQSVAFADRAMQAREVDAILSIPYGFEREVTAGRTAVMQLVLNAEDGSAAGVTQSYVSQIVGSYTREVRLRFDAGRGRGRQGVASRPPVDPQIELVRSRWYNEGLEYRDFMVPGILVALVTIIGTLLTAINIVREKESGTLDQLNVTPISRASFIAAKLIPLWILALVILAVGVAISYIVFDMPVRGNLVLVFVGAGLYLLGALGIGLWISTVSETQQQALFLSYAIMLVYLLMSGLFTPVGSMPAWAQLLARASPVMHFTSLMRSVLLKGAGVADVARELTYLTGIGALVLGLAVTQYRKRGD